MMNFFIFFLSTRDFKNYSAQNMRRRREYNRQMEAGAIKPAEIKEIPYTENVNMKKKVVGFVCAKLFHKKYGASF